MQHSGWHYLGLWRCLSEVEPRVKVWLEVQQKLEVDRTTEFRRQSTLGITIHAELFYTCLTASFWDNVGKPAPKR